MISVKLSVGIALASSYLFVVVLSSTKFVKVLPGDAKSFVVKPVRSRIPISSNFAKKYWISGTFFNKENFQGLPMSFYFSGSKCISVPSQKALSSLKPTGCVMLYTSKDCQGPYAVVTHELADLNTVGMEHSIGSMKACPPVDDSWKPQGTRTLNNDREETTIGASRKSLSS